MYNRMCITPICGILSENFATFLLFFVHICYVVYGASFEMDKFSVDFSET